MKNVVLDEVMKEFDEKVYACMKNICKYYKKDYRKMIEKLGVI